MKFFGLFLFFIICFLSCDSDKCIVNTYDCRNEIITEFRDMSLTRRGPIILLYIYKSGMSNMYAFRECEDKSQIELTNVGLRFEYEDFDRLNPNDTTPVQLVNSLLTKMKQFDIVGFTSEFQSFGIALKLYFEDYYEMFYVPDMDAVANPEWKKDVNSANKLDDYWYWRRLK